MTVEAATDDDEHRCAVCGRAFPGARSTFLHEQNDHTRDERRAATGIAPPPMPRRRRRRTGRIGAVVVAVIALIAWGAVAGPCADEADDAPLDEVCAAVEDLVADRSERRLSPSAARSRLLAIQRQAASVDPDLAVASAQMLAAADAGGSDERASRAFLRRCAELRP